MIGESHNPEIGDIWMIEDWGYDKEYYLILEIRYNVDKATGVNALRLNDGTPTYFQINMKLDNWIFVA